MTREVRDLQLDLDESAAVIDQLSAELRIASVQIRRLEDEVERLRHAGQRVVILREGLVPVIGGPR